ncbi:MAG: DUF4388 domain-containing protein, partial [Nitrospirae bacterium]|nr:DUF4388 domain-containing protein [Nitrospirota bacterium]
EKSEPLSIKEEEEMPAEIPPYFFDIKEELPLTESVEEKSEPLSIKEEEEMPAEIPPYFFDIKEELPLTESVEEKPEPLFIEQMKGFFYKELPSILQNSIVDILAGYGVIKKTDIALSGSLADFRVYDILKLISDKGLSGRLFIYSKAMNSEIYFDGGRVAYALTSGQDRDDALFKLMQGHGKLQADASQQDLTALTAKLSSRIYEAVISASNLKDGGFYFEKKTLPDVIINIPTRLNAVSLIFEDN